MDDNEELDVLQTQVKWLQDVCMSQMITKTDIDSKLNVDTYSESFRYLLRAFNNISASNCKMYSEILKKIYEGKYLVVTVPGSMSQEKHYIGKLREIICEHVSDFDYGEDQPIYDILRY